MYGQTLPYFVLFMGPKRANSLLTLWTKVLLQDAVLVTQFTLEIPLLTHPRILNGVNNNSLI